MLRDSVVISSVDQRSASKPPSSSQAHPLEQVKTELKKSYFKIIDNMRSEMERRFVGLRNDALAACDSLDPA